jgi:hypothetical protein
MDTHLPAPAPFEGPARVDRSTAPAARWGPVLGRAVRQRAGMVDQHRGEWDAECRDGGGHEQ